MQVKDIMTEPVTIDKSERLGHALDIMEKNDLRRLLVTNKGKIGGIITTRQIARVLGVENLWACRPPLCMWHQPLRIALSRSWRTWTC